MTVLIFVVCFLLLLLSNVTHGCRSTPPPSPPQTSNTNTATTTTPLMKQCYNFQNISEMNQNTALCSSKLIYNCTLNQPHIDFQFDITNITENCNCKSRTNEFFCHYILPECSINSDNCETLQRDQPNVTLPCSHYCHQLFDNCFTEDAKENLNDYMLHQQNMTIDELCDYTVNFTDCWESSPFEQDDCLVESTKTPESTTSIFEKEETNTSEIVTTTLKKDGNSQSLGVPIIVVSFFLMASVIGGFLYTRYRRSSRKPTLNENKPINPNMNESPGKEGVRNDNPVDVNLYSFAAENNAGSVYTKVK